MLATLPPLTLGGLRLHEGLNEQVGGLRVEGQGVAQGLQVRALLQEGLLEAHAARVEVLLWAQGGEVRPEAALRAPPSGPSRPVLRHPSALCNDALDEPGTSTQVWRRCSPTSTPAPTLPVGSQRPQNSTHVSAPFPGPLASTLQPP